MISGVQNISISGLQAASKRLENSANNLANINTVSTETRPAFEPQDIVQISEAAGGVRTEAVTRDPATVSVPTVEGNVVQAPNVDISEEIIAQQTAANDYRANLAAIRAEDDQTQSLLDIIA